MRSARGEAAGTVGERAAGQILKRMEEVLRKLNEAKPEEAMERVREAQAEVAEFAGKGEITTREQATALDEALDALLVAIQSA